MQADMASAPHGTRTAVFTPQKGVHDLLYRLIIQQNVPFRNTKEGTAQNKRCPWQGLSLFVVFLRGAGGALGAAAALVNAHMVRAAAASLQITAALVVTVDVGFRRGGRVVGGDIAAALAVAVAAADSIPGAGVADLNAVQAAAARLIMAAVILRTVKIVHS